MIDHFVGKCKGGWRDCNAAATSGISSAIRITNGEQLASKINADKERTMHQRRSTTFGWSSVTPLRWSGYASGLRAAFD
jgi:hypothetical protein